VAARHRCFTGDSVTVTPTTAGGGIEGLAMTWNGYVSAADTVTVHVCNIAKSGTLNPPAQAWRADVDHH
jgi:hypothetical protein